MAIFANMKRIILITGGERSGKSVYAEQLALRLSVNGEERNGPTSRKKNT